MRRIEVSIPIQVFVVQHVFKTAPLTIRVNSPVVDGNYAPVRGCASAPYQAAIAISVRAPVIARTPSLLFLRPLSKPNTPICEGLYDTYKRLGMPHGIVPPPIFTKPETSLIGERVEVTGVEPVSKRII
jgi:hypothetical protein